MEALYEAIVLVVLIALIGFWEWRSALLMAVSMPIALIMTFGMAHMVNIDLQQVSIATLIIALGLLVDNPVVANDAIKRELADGRPPIIAAWLGPTKLNRAILYATLTNIIAYLPFLMLTGSTGDFLHSLPIVMAAALISSRMVSTMFTPLLGYYLLRPPKRPEPSIEERRARGFYGGYYRLARGAIRWRWAVIGISLLFLASGVIVGSRLKSQFFPDDVQYWSYVDVWLPNDAALSATDEAASRVESIVRRVCGEYARAHPSKESGELLESLTTFVGGGGPRFWYSAAPELPQRNYALILIRLRDKEATPQLIGPIQSAVSREVTGAYVTLHQLQTNPVEFPVEVRISGTSDVDPKDEPADIETLRKLAGAIGNIFRPLPGVQVVQNDWFAESPEVKLTVDPDRANLAGITNSDVAASAATAMQGTTVTTLRQGNQQIPVIARLTALERGQLSDVQNLYVYSSQGSQKVPLRTRLVRCQPNGDRADPPSGAFPNHRCPCFPAGRGSGIGDPSEGRPATHRIPETHAARLSDADWGGKSQAAERIRKFDNGSDDFDPGNLCRVTGAIRQRGKAAVGTRGRSLWGRGRTALSGADGGAVRLHGIPGNH